MSRHIYFWININDLPIALVLEQNPRLIIRNYLGQKKNQHSTTLQSPSMKIIILIINTNLKIRCGITCTCLSLPIIKTHITRPWHQGACAGKVWLKIFCFQTMCIVDITAYFLAFWVQSSDKEY